MTKNRPGLTRGSLWPCVNKAKPFEACAALQRTHSIFFPCFKLRLPSTPGRPAVAAARWRCALEGVEPVEPELGPAAPRGIELETYSVL